MVLLYLGLPEIFESEGMDRSHMRLPANQNRLLEAVAAANPKVVVVLSGGSPVELPWYDKAAAIVTAIWAARLAPVPWPTSSPAR